MQQLARFVASVHLGSHVTLAGGQITIRRLLRGFGFLDQCQTRLLRRSAHPQLAIETALSVQSGNNAKELRRLVSGKIREELIIANWPVIGREPSADCRVLLQLS